MGRKKKFDPEQAVEAAMQVFWLKGYEATSIDDLTEAIGIKRGSLYDSFGSKHELFVMALRRYSEQACPPGNLSEVAGSAFNAIRYMFQQTINESVDDRLCRGCFMVNTIAELAARDKAVAELGEAHRSMFRDVFVTLLTQAADDGDIDSDADIDVLADYLVSAFFGLRVTSKINPDRQLLENIAEQTMASIQ